MRILCLSNMWPGADDPDYGAFVADMCRALADRGHQVDAVAIDTRARGAVRTPAKYARLAARAARAARRADVIYAHYLFPTAAVAAAAAATARIPFVVTAHGQDVRNLERPRVSRATAGPLRRAAGVIAVSEHLAEELRASGLDLPPMSVVNMGVDTARFHPRDRDVARGWLRLPAGAPVVLAVGGLTERKNPLGLLQAFARVRAARPDAVLALVGDGPLAGAVDAGARRLGIGDAVVRPGALPHAAVADWITACDVLCVVSRVEPLGVVALEALASGRPVVATRVGGTSEVVPADGAGRIVDPLDPVVIGDAILSLLDDPPTPEACRAAAEPHALSRQAERVAAILEAAVAARRQDAAGAPQ